MELVQIDPLDGERLERALAGGPQVLWAAVGAVPLLVFTAIMSLYVRSAIVTVLVSGVFFAPLVMIMALDWVAPPSGGEPSVWLWVWRNAVMAAALGAWLFYLFCRTAIQERGPGVRFAFGILFAVTAIELAATVFLCDFRDLLFIVTGM